MRELAARLQRAERLVILSHVDPDGDAAGSALGLAWILRGLGKDARVALPGGIPALYDFLPGADAVADAPAGLPGAFDAGVAVDATSPSRLGDLAEVLARGAEVFDVDHHGDNARYGDLAWVDPTACATALMIHEMAREAGWKVGPEAATCLYAGILTDTGRFTFGNTDARALAVAAELVELGAIPDEVAGKVYERRTVASVRLLARALDTLDVREAGRVACVHVTPEMLAQTGAIAEETEGLSNWARSIEGVKIGLFFRDTGDGSVKISFRSNGGVSVDALARRFGGGGHPNAAGARVRGPLEEAKEAVLRAVREHLGHPV